MNGGSGEAAQQIYPASYFTKAPTYKKWVKLTAADVQNLRQEPSFEGQSIYFHLNHPIEYVYLIGPIVAIDHVTTKYNTYFTTLEIDDGSGSVIEVKITYKGRDVKQGTAVSSKDGAGLHTSTDDDTEQEEESDPLAEKRHDDHKPASLQNQVFETTVPDLVITSSHRTGWVTLLNGTQIDVGTVLKVKGQLQRFRDVFQLQLKRAFIVSTMDDEIAAWKDYGDFSANVLSKPWVIGRKELAELENEKQEQVARERQTELRRREYEKRKRVFEGKTREREARREKRRELEAREMDGNALDKPAWKPYKPSLAPAVSPSPQPGPANATAQAQASVDKTKISAHAAAHRGIVVGSGPNDGFKKPALPPQITGFIRPSALMSTDTASMPWRHEIANANSRARSWSQLPMAGPALGTNRTSRLAVSIDGEHTGPWRHERTNNPAYKKPVP